MPPRYLSWESNIGKQRGGLQHQCLWWLAALEGGPVRVSELKLREGVGEWGGSKEAAGSPGIDCSMLLGKLVQGWRGESGEQGCAGG
jgi:hypothetical protein